MTATKNNARLVAASLVSEVNAVLLARTHAELMRKKIDAMHAAVLDYLDVHDNEGKRITEPKHSWCLADKYEAAYYAELDNCNAAMGYKLEPGHCPALIAEDLQRKAENLLVESSARFFPGVLLCHGLDTRRKYIDLLIGLVVNAPGYQKPRI